MTTKTAGIAYRDRRTLREAIGKARKRQIERQEEATSFTSLASKQGPGHSTDHREKTSHDALLRYHFTMASVRAWPRMLRQRRARSCLGLVVVTLALSSTIAAAQTEDEKRATARGLAQSGLNAFNEGKLDDAIDRFRRAEALVHAPPHLLYIARASASLGKLVQANEAYLRIVREEVASTAPKAFVDAKKSATQEQAALEPRIPKLTIVVKVGQGASGAAGNAPEPVVTMDGAVVPAALVGVAHPVDPGAHTLSATARGYKANDVAIKVNESASETATAVRYS